MVGGVGGLQGTLAEYIAADVNLLALKSDKLSMREAAALPLKLRHIEVGPVILHRRKLLHAPRLHRRKPRRMIVRGRRGVDLLVGER